LLKINGERRNMKDMKLKADEILIESVREIMKGNFSLDDKANAVVSLCMDKFLADNKSKGNNDE
jgi:hypothetical protein